jgi:hypothetical protein
MTGSASVFINPLPTIFNVTGGGAICPGASALIGLSGSQTGVSYQIKLAGLNIGSPVLGTGSALNFLSTILNLPGVYTIIATDITTGCSQAMNGSALINLNLAPAAQEVTGGGDFCAGSAGVSIGLNNSQLLVSYQLKNGNTNVGSPVTPLLGGAINFGTFTTPGTYTVVATNALGCANTMNGNAVVNTVSLPTIFDVTGGGSYCPGGNGVSVGLGSSEAGINYQLKRGSTNVGSVVAGTGSAIDFGLQTATGIYTVVATTITASCSQAMMGSAVISIYSQPTLSTIVTNVSCPD